MLDYRRVTGDFDPTISNISNNKSFEQTITALSWKPPKTPGSIWRSPKHQGVVGHLSDEKKALWLYRLVGLGGYTAL